MQFLPNQKLLKNIFAYLSQGPGPDPSADYSPCGFAPPVPPNQPPIADAGIDVRVESTDGSLGSTGVSLTGSGIDPEGGPLTYSWQIDGQGYTGQSVAVQPTQGTSTVTLTVTDDAGASASDGVEIVISDTKLPEISFALDWDGHTLNATALVHEAYMRLVQQERVRWQSRAHFSAFAPMSMRRILVNYAATRGRGKRGGGAPHIPSGESVGRKADP